MGEFPAATPETVEPKPPAPDEEEERDWSEDGEDGEDGGSDDEDFDGGDDEAALDDHRRARVASPAILRWSLARLLSEPSKKTSRELL